MHDPRDLITLYCEYIPKSKKFFKDDVKVKSMKSLLEEHLLNSEKYIALRTKQEKSRYQIDLDVACKEFLADNLEDRRN